MTWPCQGRCLDAAWISNKGWAYFFKGSQFWRYDIPYDKVDLGDADITYPRQMRRWRGFRFSSGIVMLRSVERRVVRFLSIQCHTQRSRCLVDYDR